MSDEIALRKMLRRAHDIIRSAGGGSWVDETNEWRATAFAWICDLEAIIEGDLAAASAPSEHGRDGE